MAYNIGLFCAFSFQNLSETVDNVKLQETFQKFGSILSCKVARSDDGKSRGYGFIQFETEESAKAAIEKLNDSILEGKQMCDLLHHILLSSFEYFVFHILPFCI